MPTAPLRLADVAEDLRLGRMDAVDLVREVCDRIDAQDADLAALLPEAGRRERLLRDARALQAQYPRPGERPTLYGVPVGIKDLFRVDGWETRAGSDLPPELFAGPEARVVTRLREHGALMLGRTVCTEFAFSDPGPTRNPHDPTHTPGGSSSGSAAAVAAGFCPLALGTQTIGSIARPASYCGVVGFKPSYGRVPADGVVPFSASADHVGCFTQDLAGAALAAAVLCDAWDGNAASAGGRDRLRIGVPDGAYLALTEPAMFDFFEEQVARLRRDGHEVIEIDLFPDIAQHIERHYQLIAAELAAYHRPWFERHRDRYRTGSRELIEKGLRVTPAELDAARAGQAALRERIMACAAEAGIDLWLSPSATGPAPAGLAATGNPRMNLPWSYAGLPTVTLPAGRTAKGLPLGLQLAGGYLRDEHLLARARMLDMS